MNDVWEILGVFALSAIKFGIGGVPAAVFAKFSFLKTVVVTTSGGITGAMFFTYLSKWVLNIYCRIKEKRIKHQSIVQKKKFTRANKFIVSTKRKFGLVGISIVTPPILSFPLGVFVAVRYYHNKQKIIIYMAISTFIWSILLYFFYNYFYQIIF